ncbi:MAG: DNA polymerase/3'-5' exonuclease PolX [Candidatus Pacebacteria bacterium]|nr:DNA polymerase/3'-5' exonuclease PolX [Candidatus Paceibacterota bacterium]
MDNGRIAGIIREVGEYIQVEEGLSFRARAYDRAAETIESLAEPLTDTYAKGGINALLEIKGIGRGLGDALEEIITTGKSSLHEELKRALPIDLPALNAVQGLGPQKIRVLYKELKIKNLEDLEKAAIDGKIRVLDGFGEKSEEKILRGVEFLKRGAGRMLLGDALPWGRNLEKELLKLKGVRKATLAGSARRRRETVGDLDMLVVADDAPPIMDYFIAMPDVEEVLANGATKSAVRLKNGLQVDLRVVPAESYGAALNYFTGSRDHNIALRQIAQDKGLKLNEYGLFRGDVAIAGFTEEGIYAALGLEFVPPELRENSGEVELAGDSALPALIDYNDLCGDLQVQTSWTDGVHSIDEMAAAAMAIGLDYMVVTDHTKRLAMMGGLDEKKIRLQMKEIDAVNARLVSTGKKFRVLKGSECDILKDGSLDLPDDVLAELDVVGVSIHSYFDLPRAEQTARVIKAITNPHADIFFHPTARKINARPACDFDMEAVLDAAQKAGTVMEIDAFPDRLDLCAEHIRMCVKRGIKLAIDSDAHDKTHFSVLEYGIAQARRGWAQKEDIVNAWPVEKMLGMLKKSA